ncbi:MAG TPA: type VI immunity family protein [Archangium sp.]|uniref:type VI immunity family protein n=1 Tax=Archangium sp. TaxID=1872627 RepID=UPI002E36B0BD|nr:type VI immunity family protein [Archangium sp.]HEX5749857.1 type VI immunity family protein [Archangium sp.]
MSHAVKSYMQAVGQGPSVINHLYTNDDEGNPLNEETWDYLHYLLRPERPFRFIEELSDPTLYRLQKRGYATQLIFDGGFGSTNGYQLWYRARLPSRTPPPNLVSTLTATLPTEYLHTHGPTKVRELALEMASQLRFTTGHVGLALQLYWPLRSREDAFRAELLRYPGIDLRPAWSHAHRMGTRVDGVHWLNFLAQPVLGQLGGATALRARLQSPETTVYPLDEERTVIALGEHPEAGDLSTGQALPAYRELARVLEPWLEPLDLSDTTTLDQPPTYSSLRLTQDEATRWWRRFLD